MPSALNEIALEPDVAAAIEAHARNCDPQECCGLIAVDTDFEIRFVYPLTNLDQSSQSFTVDPDEHFAALKHAESRGWTIEGTFHSHPFGPDTLSAIDIEGLTSGWIHILVSPSGLSCWALKHTSATRIRILDS